MATAAAAMMETPRRAEAAMTSSVPKTAKKSLRNVVELTPENFKDYISADAKKTNFERVRGVLRAVVPVLPKVGTDMERVAERVAKIRE